VGIGRLTRRDVAFAGVKKGFISNRAASSTKRRECRWCADWLKTIVPEVAGAVHPGRRSLLEAAVIPRAHPRARVVNRIKAVMAVQGVPWSDADDGATASKFGGSDHDRYRHRDDVHGHVRGDHAAPPSAG